MNNRYHFTSELNKVIKWNCRQLSLFPPRTEIVEPDELPTPTTKAAVSFNGEEIGINELFADSYDINEPPLMLWLTISHECRHIWQMRNESFRRQIEKDYKTSDKLTLKEYNEQTAEIDAWAW